MLTLKQKQRLGEMGEWIALCRPAILQVASDVTHERPHTITFSSAESLLDEHEDIRTVVQAAAHQKRVALARAVTASPQAMQEAARRGAALLAAAMGEDISKLSAEQGAAVASLMAAFLDSSGQLPEAQQAALDNAIMQVVRVGWSAQAGYNAHYEIPAAIAGAA